MRAWRTPSAQWDDDSFWKCNNLRGCFVLFLSAAAKCSETWGCLGLHFFSLILGKWNCNGQRRKQLKARVALFFPRLLTCDQQTKWVRAGFHNTSGGFPHSPRWGFRIFFTKRDFDSFPNLLSLLQAPLGAPGLQFGHLYTQNPPGSSGQPGTLAFVAHHWFRSLPLWLTHTLSLGMDIPLPWKETKPEGRTCLLGAQAQQNPNPKWDAAAGDEPEPSSTLVDPGKIAQWFGHDKDIEQYKPV